MHLQSRRAAGSRGGGTESVETQGSQERFGGRRPGNGHFVGLDPDFAVDVAEVLDAVAGLALFFPRVLRLIHNPPLLS